MVLLVVIRLDDKAYGVPISDELRARTGREVSLASIYAALERLARKQYVSSILADPTPERGGRAKRYFRVTEEGKRAAEIARTAFTRLWNELPRFREVNG